MTGAVLHGVIGSPGIALGQAFVLRPETEEESVSAEGEEASPRSLEDERAAWQEACRRVEETYLRLAERAREVAGPDEAAILEAQGMMAADPELEAQVNLAIDGGLPAAEATRRAIAGYAGILATLGDEYMQQRADDVREIGRAMLRSLAGNAPIPLAELAPDSILCAQELPAGALLAVDRSRLAALALGSGGPTSHIAILARTLGVPAVLGLGDALLNTVSTGMRVGVDGGRGEVYVDPSEEQLAALDGALQAYTREHAEIAALVGQPAITPDGFRVELFANIGGPGDIPAALEAGAEGIGLFRTEFLIVGHATLPSEEEQYVVYRSVLEAMGSRTVIFRTFDIGGDKPVPALALPPEANPFLGYRALRIGLDRQELLATQFRAILRAGKGGYNAWIMLPMVATVEEIRRAREIFERAKREVYAEAPLGIMIEIPAAAINASSLASEADFFSIGTNDLVQYTLAVDRLDERLAGLYQPFHPAVLRLIKMAAEAAATAGKPCGVCGEMGGDPRATALLLGLGVTELSMSAGSLGYQRREVRRTPLTDARELADQALTCATTQEVLSLVEAFRAANQ